MLLNFLFVDTLCCKTKNISPKRVKCNIRLCSSICVKLSVTGFRTTLGNVRLLVRKLPKNRRYTCFFFQLYTLISNSYSACQHKYLLSFTVNLSTCLPVNSKNVLSLTVNLSTLPILNILIITLQDNVEFGC